MPKKVMILEDNTDTLEFLARLVKNVAPDAVVMKFDSINGVYEAAMSSYIDLFIVDIILDKSVRGDISGLGFVQKIREVAKYEFTPVIFVTALQDPEFYAYSHLHSYSFIEKPIVPAFVEETIRKAMRFPNGNTTDPELFFRRDGLIIKVNCSEILYMESVGHKLRLHLANGRVEAIPYKTCKQIIAEVGTRDFFQCSRNTIINKRHVENVNLANQYIKIKGVDEPITVGITYRSKTEKEFSNVG